MTKAGESVGGYQLVRPLGEGPFGVVWRARDARGASLVVKVLHASFIQSPAGQAAFTRLITSVRAHERIQHDNLARVFGVIQDGATSAYGMAVEYIEGRSVSEIRLPAGDQVQDMKSVSVVLAWFEELGEVLAWLHAQGVVHGNLKPSNIKLVREAYGHRIKVLDLPWSAIGLAAPVEGQPSYLAPEQLRGAPPSAYSDQWSMARLLADILAASDRPGGIPLPHTLAMTIQRATHPDPGFRFTQMMELVGALRAVRAELARPLGGYTPYAPYGNPNASTPGLLMPGGMGPDASMPGVPVMGPGMMAPMPSISPVQPLAPAATPPVAGARDPDSVYVPTARALGTTASGALPETGEHEALFGPVSLPTPVVSDHVPSQDGNVEAPAPQAPVSPAPVPPAPVSPAPFPATMPNGEAREPQARADTMPLPVAASASVSIEAPRRRTSWPIALAVVVLLAAGVGAGVRFAISAAKDRAAPLATPEGGTVPPASDFASPASGADAGPGDAAPSSTPEASRRTKKRDAGRAARRGTSTDAAPPNGPRGPRAPDAGVAVAEVDPVLEEAQVGCDEGDGQSCLEVSDYFRRAGQIRSAVAAERRACTFDTSAGCLRAGRSMRRLRPNLAFEALSKACQLGEAEGCDAAAKIAKAGRADGVGKKEADRLDARACDLGRKTSCPPPTRTSTKS